MSDALLVYFTIGFVWALAAVMQAKRSWRNVVGVVVVTVTWPYWVYRGLRELR